MQLSCNSFTRPLTAGKCDVLRVSHGLGDRLQQRASNDNASVTMLNERGVDFFAGDAFYRADSAQARDLAILAATVYKRQTGRLRVLDVMAGSGVRGARYLQQAGADFVWSNDYDARNRGALVYNLCSSLEAPP